MRPIVKHYIDFFNKTLNLSGISWWIIDFKDKPDHYFCNDLMKETFSLNKDAIWHPIAQVCPIAGDYNKNIAAADKSDERAKVVIDEYYQIIRRETDEYSNTFPYYNKDLDKTFYFLSRAKVLEVDENNEVSIIYGFTQDVTEQELQKQALQELSTKDHLTKLYNRLKIDENIAYELEKAKRYKIGFSLILFDIDFFKSVNDNYGHLEGDRLLVELSELLRKNIRNVDIVGRWGGEEFIIICPATDKDSAVLLAEKLRKLIENSTLGITKNTTVSLGVTEYKQDDTTDTLVDRVDDALYKAKEAGRNRVEVL